MLEKIVKDKYSPTNSLSGKNSLYKSSGLRKKESDHDFEELETIILQKDIEITELLERISYLSECIDHKN